MNGPDDRDPVAALLAAAVRESVNVKNSLLPLHAEIGRAARMLSDAYGRGNKALFFGNGGSAADAQHMAGELVGRFLLDRKPLPALALHTNPSAITAIANDIGYDEIFSRQLQAFSRPGDVAVAISTSGTSQNVVNAAKLRDHLDIRVIAMTGAEGGALAAHADVVITVPSKSVPRIQEAHCLIGHVLCAWVERELFSNAG